MQTSMARSYAQLAAVVFAIVGIGGFITGDAGSVVNGHAGGNFDGVALHFTYLRDIIDLAIAGVLGYAGFVAPEAAAVRTVLGAGAFLLLLATAGFIVGDTDSGSGSVLTLHFPIAINIFDLVAGTLAVLSGLGGEEEPSPAGA
jgi:hypothetical protein